METSPAALCLAANGKLSRVELREVLSKSADKIGGVTYGATDEFGARSVENGAVGFKVGDWHDVKLVGVAMSVG